MTTGANNRPKNWLQCPHFGELIDETFVPLKTFYDGDDDLPEEYQFTPEIFIKEMLAQNIEIGLVINLTYSTRYYDSGIFKHEFDIEFHQILCRGHGEAPSDNEQSEFIKTCRQFISRKPHKRIAVHCTHGFNRTGFMICSYLYAEKEWPIDGALSVFAQKRPPGIYKQHYIDKLYSLYADEDDPVLEAPMKPEWDDDDELVSGIRYERAANEDGRPVFFEAVTEVDILRSPAMKEKIYRHCANLCGMENRRGLTFPGAQPVSIDLNNINLLRLHRYRVSWKADGCRFMLYIQDADNIFFLARNLFLYKVGKGLRFPKLSNLEEHLVDTLVDGEMVLDTIDNKKVPRYLIYDVICYNGDNTVRLQDFDARCRIIRKYIIEPRDLAKKKNLIIAEEPLKVRDKGFFLLEATKKTIDLQVPHEKDGLIFQPLSAPYTGGTCSNILKWKPPSLNSIDFKLVIREERKPGMLPETRAFLYVCNKNDPLFNFKISQENSDYHKYNNKIVECVLEDRNGRKQWKILRERTDKPAANSYETARATFDSIVHPVTEQHLLSIIKSKPPELRPPQQQQQTHHNQQQQEASK